MARRYSTNPFDHEPEGSLTFTDVTTLVLLLVAISALTALLVLGMICADHRIVSALNALV